MKFTTLFEKKVKSSTIRMRLALALDISYYTIDRWLNLNKCDELTKPKHLSTLCEITGLTESEIFDNND